MLKEHSILPTNLRKEGNNGAIANLSSVPNTVTVVYTNKPHWTSTLDGGTFKKMQQNNEVDVNVLVNLYNSKLSSALNQNVLLEAKLQTLKNDFEKERNELLAEIANLKGE